MYVYAWCWPVIFDSQLSPFGFSVNCPPTMNLREFPLSLSFFGEEFVEYWKICFSKMWLNSLVLLFLKDFIYLFLKRGEGREKKREKHQCVVASHVPQPWGPGPQPRHVPWLGIELVTLWFTGLHSIHWATPARALYICLIVVTRDLSISLVFSFFFFKKDFVYFSDREERREKERE